MTNACPQCAYAPMEPIARYEDYAAVAKHASDERGKIFQYMQRLPGRVFDAFVACNACGFIKVTPTPSREVLADFYQNYYGSSGYSAKIDKKLKRTLKRLRRLKRYVTDGSFLDVGCNVGVAVEAARRMGYHGTGIEIDSAAVNRARELFHDNRYETSTIEAFDPGHQFDLVHCTEVLEHVTDTVAFAKHLARLTKPGGYLFLTTPDAGHWRRPKRFVEWAEVKPLEHINWQTKRSIRRLFNSQGFEVVRILWSLKPGLRIIARRVR